MFKAKKNPRIRAILFDLGKVIVHFDFNPAFIELSQASSLTREEIRGYFHQSGLEVLYDAGKISSQAFYREVKQSLGHTLNYKQFQKVWNEIFTPNKDIWRLIRSLKGRYRLVLISNTNQMHYRYIRKRYRILDDFDGLVVSYKEKIRKPDERIYRKAAKICRAKPSEIFYIDDRRDLTEAAKEIGFNVFTFKNNIHHLQKKLIKLGVKI